LTIEEPATHPIGGGSNAIAEEHAAPPSNGSAPPRIVAVTLASDTSVTGDLAPDTAAVTNTGVPSVDARTSPATIEELIEQATADLAKDPSDARLQWRLGLLLLAAGRTIEAGELSPELTERQRGLLARQVALETALADLLADRPDSANATFAAAKALRDALRHDAELSLPVLALCSKVTTFGVYEVLPDSALAPYRANRAIVYCEVGNLAAENERSNHHRALLATRLELFAEDGRSLWTHEEPRIEDVSRRRREDFFIAQIVTFPPTLGPGTYILKATVTDLIADKTNETTQEIQIGGDTALSAASTP
jgi:hypothetical protein